MDCRKSVVLAVVLVLLGGFELVHRTVRVQTLILCTLLYRKPEDTFPTIPLAIRPTVLFSSRIRLRAKKHSHANSSLKQKRLKNSFITPDSA